MSKENIRPKEFVITDLEVLQEELTNEVLLQELIKAIPTDDLSAIVQFIATIYDIDLENC